MDTFPDPNLTPDVELALRHSLEQSNIFGDLSFELICDLINSMKVIALKGGERMLTQGKSSNSMLIVISGRLLALRRNADGSSRRLAEIGPGSSVGEVGLVLQQPRAADVVAIRDSSVAQLYREEFEQLLKIHPVELNRVIARKMFEYSNIQSGKPVNAGGTAYAVVPLDQGIDYTDFCRDLEKSLKHHGSVILISSEHGEQMHDNEGVSIESNQKLAKLEHEYDSLIYQASDTTNPWSQLAVRQADKVIFLVTPNTDIKSICFDLPMFFGAGFEMVRKSLVIIHPKATETPKVNQQWREVIDLHRIYPVRSGHREDFARLGRFMSDNAIGLVLGGGGARGLAHVGVLKALNEFKIPVDMICGNSMGALIGAQYANGTPIDELIGKTQRFTKGGERPTIPIHSIFGGNRMRRDLQKMFGDATIEAQWLQLFTVSCNLSHATVHVHDSGPVWQAVLASNSPAAVVPPVIHNGDLLVDAALLDNVPVESMRQRLGFGTIIAVDVDVQDELKVSPSIERVNPWKLLWQRLFVKEAKYIPGILDILNRSGHLGGLMRRDASKAMADFYLQPPVRKFSLMGYSKGEQIAKAGYDYTKARIKRWQSKVNQTD